MKTLNEVIKLTRGLPEELQSEVRDFARFLQEERVPRPRRKLRQDWATASASSETSSPRSNFSTRRSTGGLKQPSMDALRGLEAVSRER